MAWVPSIGQNLQSFTGNDDVSIMSEKFSSGTKNSKQIEQIVYSRRQKKGVACMYVRETDHTVNTRTCSSYCRKLELFFNINAY